MAVNLTDQSVNIASWTAYGDGKLHGLTPLGPDDSSVVKSILMTLAGAGRVSFYVDYSERATAGAHTFYVQRTHGSAGGVTVDFLTSGDTHTVASGSITWNDGEIGIKSFTATVGSKSVAGDHRIVATLSNATGGLTLHHGAKTIAYGVIDDGTIAIDASAVFYDSEASGGTGTQVDPYDSIYTAIANVGSKRYIYGKGTTIPDGTDTCTPGGGGTSNCIDLPATRTSEATRVHIRNWPGFTWAIDGNAGADQAGFYASGADESYQTIRGIDFNDLDNTGQSLNGFAIFYNYGSSTQITVEKCTVVDINGSTNNGGVMVWGVDGAKIWRSTFSNIQKLGDANNENTAGVFTYDGKNISIQRCEFDTANSAFYHKRIETNLDVSIEMAFSIVKTTTGAHYGASGSSGGSHSYSRVYSNLFKGCTTGGIRHAPGLDVGNDIGKKLYWVNNVFVACGAGEVAAIHGTRLYTAIMFNNIFYNCRKVWADYYDTSALGPVIEYADYNKEYGTTLTAQRYEWEAVNYSTRAALFAAGGYANNDTDDDPLFTDEPNDDVTRTADTNGVYGTTTGAYFTALETLGAA